MTRWAPLALGMALLLGGCGDEADEASRDAASEGSTTGTAEPLPKPEGAIGSVTGMPAHPGPGTSRIEPIEPVAIGATGDGVESQPGMPGSDPQIIYVSPPGDVDADLAAIPPAFPETPEPPALVLPPAPSLPDSPSPNAAPVGTEGATESTTIVVDPTETDD